MYEKVLSHVIELMVMEGQQFYVRLRSRSMRVWVA